MGNLVLSGATSGSITLEPTAVAGTNTITLPALTGTVLTSASPQSAFPSNIAGTGPAFRVYLSANQTVTNVTNTKVTLDTEIFDTANCFNTSTNRFTPNVAGYYQFNVMLGASASSSLSYNYIQIYKNGVFDSIAIYGPYSNAANYGVLSTLISMNGTTDYIELYVQISGTGTLTVSGGATAVSTYMSGFLARAA
jgi:hypothetical protein